MSTKPTRVVICGVFLGVSDPKARGLSAQLEALGLVGMELLGSREEQVLGLDDVRIWHATVDGTDRCTLLAVVEPDTFGAQDRVDLEDVLPFLDRSVRALGLAHPAIDALLRDQGRQLDSPP
jgi:hypothetical protein